MAFGKQEASGIIWGPPQPPHTDKHRLKFQGGIRSILSPLLHFCSSGNAISSVKPAAAGLKREHGKLLCFPRKTALLPQRLACCILNAPVPRAGRTFNKNVAATGADTRVMGMTDLSNQDPPPSQTLEGSTLGSLRRHRSVFIWLRVRRF